MKPESDEFLRDVVRILSPDISDEAVEAEVAIIRARRVSGQTRSWSERTALLADIEAHLRKRLDTQP